MDIDREQVIGHRLRANHLDRRLPSGSLVDAAFAGLQDSAPRAALVALHARVEEVAADAWEDASLAQVWHRAGAVFVIPAADLWVWSLAAVPSDPAEATRLARLGAAVRSILEGRGQASQREVFQAIGDLRHPYEVRPICRAAGITIRWDARATTILETPPVDGDPHDARTALARRFFRSLGPTDAAAFRRWAGIGRAEAQSAVTALRPELVAVRVAGRERFILEDDAGALRAATTVKTTRLLPLGLDPYLQTDRELLVPDEEQRAWAWSPRRPDAVRSTTPFPSGVLLVDGEVQGFYRRQRGQMTATAFVALSRRQRDAVEAEAASLRIPGVEGEVRVSWSDS